jgi:hypothetical protein
LVWLCTGLLCRQVYCLELNQVVLALLTHPGVHLLQFHRFLEQVQVKFAISLDISLQQNHIVVYAFVKALNYECLLFKKFTIVAHAILNIVPGALLD